MSKLLENKIFSAELILDLITGFNSDNHPEELNFFNEDERLECLASDVLASKLYEHFTVDVERLRQLLNKETLIQAELVVLCHHAIGLANTNVTAKRKGEETQDRPKKQKVAGPSVSLFFIALNVLNLL